MRFALVGRFTPSSRWTERIAATQLVLLALRTARSCSPGGDELTPTHGFEPDGRCGEAARGRATLPSMATATPLAHLDPVLEALRRAPVGEPLPADVLAEIEEREAAVAAGRVKMITHADIQEKIRALRREQGG